MMNTKRVILAALAIGAAAWALGDGTNPMGATVSHLCTTAEGHGAGQNALARGEWSPGGESCGEGTNAQGAWVGVGLYDAVKAPEPSGWVVY
jgi:hypothetical protein